MDLKTICMRVVGVYLAIWIVVLVVPLLWLWPKQISPHQVGDPDAPTAQKLESDRNENKDDQSKTITPLDSKSDKPDSPVSLVEGCPVSGLRFVGLVLIMGALGACLHGITSLAYHRGRKEFTPEWTLWYLYRPPVGAVLALIFYLIINGGLMPQVDSNSRKFFAMLGLSGLIGLFSKQALNKLSLIFDAIFASDKDKSQSSANAGKNSENQADTNLPTVDDTAKKQDTKDKQKENQP